MKRIALASVAAWAFKKIPTIGNGVPALERAVDCFPYSFRPALRQSFGGGIENPCVALFRPREKCRYKPVYFLIFAWKHGMHTRSQPATPDLLRKIIDVAIKLFSVANVIQTVPMAPLYANRITKTR